MSATELLEQIRRLPREEQCEIVETLVQELETDDELTSAQASELDRRAEEALKHPERCRPLEDVLADLDKRFRPKG